MKLSTKGRYSLLIMLYLANNYDNGRFISLSEIATNNNISLKYLEKIMLNLKKSDFFISSRGVDGGYKLKYEPKEYKLLDILEASEGNLNVTSCVSDNNDCVFIKKCLTYPVWKDLNNALYDFLSNKTLEDYRREN